MVMQVDDIEIIDFEDTDLNDATVIAGFPSIGLVSTIVANYLIDALGLKQVGALNSPHFPTLSVVHTGEPLSPVRIYGGTLDSGRRIAVFVSEFKPKPNLINALSNSILEWAQKKKCKVMMDLGGPKLRTGAIKSGPKIIHIKPKRDQAGVVTTPAKIWIAPPGIFTFTGDSSNPDSKPE